MPTSVTTHTYIAFANPYVYCGECKNPVHRWHDPAECGCTGDSYPLPCQCVNGSVINGCLTWSPVDDCTCLETLGVINHGVQSFE